MDVNKVSPGQRIAAIAGGLLFIDLWMSWYSVNIPSGAQSFFSGVDTSISAWQTYTWVDILLAVLAIVAVAGAVMAANSSTWPLPIGWAELTAGFGAVMTVVVLFRTLINQPGPSNKLVNNEWGAYVGILLLLALVYGAWRAMNEAGSPATRAAAPPPPAPAAPTV
jgi:hypothetical protein